MSENKELVIRNEDSLKEIISGFGRAFLSKQFSKETRKFIMKNYGLKGMTLFNGNNEYELKQITSTEMNQTSKSIGVDNVLSLLKIYKNEIDRNNIFKNIKNVEFSSFSELSNKLEENLKNDILNGTSYTEELPENFKESNSNLFINSNEALNLSVNELSKVKGILYSKNNLSLEDIIYVEDKVPGKINNYNREKYNELYNQLAEKKGKESALSLILKLNDLDSNIIEDIDMNAENYELEMRRAILDSVKQTEIDSIKKEAEYESCFKELGIKTAVYIAKKELEEYKSDLYEKEYSEIKMGSGKMLTSKINISLDKKSKIPEKDRLNIMECLNYYSYNNLEKILKYDLINQKSEDIKFNYEKIINGNPNEIRDLITECAKRLVLNQHNYIASENNNNVLRIKECDIDLRRKYPNHTSKEKTTEDNLSEHIKEDNFNFNAIKYIREQLDGPNADEFKESLGEEMFLKTEDIKNESITKEQKEILTWRFNNFYLFAEDIEILLKENMDSKKLLSQRCKYQSLIHEMGFDRYKELLKNNNVKSLDELLNNPLEEEKLIKWYEKKHSSVCIEIVEKVNLENAEGYINHMPEYLELVQKLGVEDKYRETFARFMHIQWYG
ncbi:MAG: hypothetical protein PHR25_01085 [Clostridia bacterium]|nr:hypothetical protein [Clostridia bacterium]MDD4375361.1 hypothetical protein [Clostridia bacterium]